MPRFAHPSVWPSLCLVVLLGAVFARAHTPYPAGEAYYADTGLDKYTVTNTAQSSLKKVAATGWFNTTRSIQKRRRYSTMC